MSLLRNTGEPAALAARRREAAAAAMDLPVPDRALHRWRYTDPTALLPGGGVTQPLLQGGTVAPPLEIELSEDARRQGVRAVAFQDALSRDTALLSEFAGRLARADDPYSAFNLATFSAGALVLVPPDVRVRSPILLRVRAGEVPEGRVAVGRTLVVAGPGSTATVLEDLDVATGFLNWISEVQLGDGATLTHGRFTGTGRGTTAFVRSAYDVGADAGLTHLDLMLAGGLLKVESSPLLRGRGARAEGLAAALVDGRARADFRVQEEHAGTDTTSRVTYRTVAMGRARSVFTGLLRILEHAARAEAYEEAKAMLLSRTANADIIPELEILNHDVKCSHGAAVGPVDEDAKFYLRTRGLTEAEAEAMLVEGFVEPVLARLPDGALAGRVRERLRAAMAGRKG